MSGEPGTSVGASTRAFVALELHADARSALAREGERLGEIAPALRPVRAENLHLTVAFLGTVSREHLVRVEQVLREELAGSPAIRLDLVGLGVFPDLKRPRVIWAGIREPGAVIELERRVRTGLERQAVRLEARDFHAHVTLARVRKGDVEADLRSVLQTSATRCFASSEFREVVLFESKLGREGARYRALARIALLRHPA